MPTTNKGHFAPGHRPWNTRDTPGCGRPEPEHDKDHFASDGKKSCRGCYLERSRRYAKERADRYKREVIDHYGGYCACCHEAEVAFLTIDHVDGNGSAHRTELFGKNKGKGGMAFYRWLIKNSFPGGFQVLCFNCNVAKHTQGVCPHQKAR